jgi:hypothetical protein
MDLGAAARDGISFFTHKRGGDGLTRARDAGIAFLAGYMVPRTPGNGGHGSVSAQVDYCIEWADELVPWWRTFGGWFWQMDTEHWSYDNVSAETGHEAAVLLNQRTGKGVVHYAPEWAYGNSVPLYEPLWASSYVSGSGDFRDLYPGDDSSRWHAYSGREPVILQYSASARIGNQSSCDANAYRGTAAQFAELVGATPRQTGDKMYILVQYDNDDSVYLTDLIHYRLVYANEFDALVDRLRSWGGSGTVETWSEEQRPLMGVQA